MTITYNCYGSGEIHLEVLKAICGETKDLSLLDCCSGFCPQTRQLGFKENTYVDSVYRELGSSQKDFIKLDIFSFLESNKKKYDVSTCLDAVEHFLKEDTLRLIRLIETQSSKQIFFTPLGDYLIEAITTDNPDSHKSGWLPKQFEDLGYATIVFPNFHPTLNVGAFFAFKCENIEQEFERVKKELETKKWATIDFAVENAIKRQSKLSKDVMEVPSMTSINIRHLLNSLGTISTKYLECGVHLAGHFCSVVYENKNIKWAVGIDNWSEFSNEKTKQECVANIEKFTPSNTLKNLIEDDCFSVDFLPKDYFDFYNYDAAHDYEAQKKAVSYFLPNLTKEFIMVVDDWAFDGVEKGTRDGIVEARLEIIFEKILITPKGEQANEHWHNSFGIFLLKQKI